MAALSKVAICNLALSHLGIAKEINFFDTEKSQEAAACRRFYDLALEQTLKDFDWPFAGKIATLQLIEADPNTEWAYSYRYPVDCVQFRKILSGIRNDTRQSAEPYKISRDTTGTIILSDKATAEGEYTMLLDNPQEYPPDFAMALSLRLAVYVAPRITGGDPYNLAKKCMDLYLVEVEIAKANARNEEKQDELPESEFVSGR
jgi:hypothetical protein